MISGADRIDNVWRYKVNVPKEMVNWYVHVYLL